MILAEQQAHVQKLLQSLPKKTYDFGIATKLAWQFIKADPSITSEAFLAAVAVQCPPNSSQPSTTKIAIDAKLVENAIRQFNAVNAGIYSPSEISKRIWKHAQSGGALDSSSVQAFMLSQPSDPVIAAKDAATKQRTQALQLRAATLVATLGLSGKAKTVANQRITSLVFSNPDASDAEVLTSYTKSPSIDL